jgi:hypothetical protein
VGDKKVLLISRKLSLAAIIMAIALQVLSDIVSPVGSFTCNHNEEGED